tara:strand:+ start:3137 stop:3667 length:531 start_codon:yes stop_codon:yes gene_type:complete
MPLVKNKNGHEIIEVSNLGEVGDTRIADALLVEISGKLTSVSSVVGQAQMLANQAGVIAELTKLNTPVRVSGLSANVQIIPAVSYPYLSIINTTGYKKLTITGWGAYGVNDGSVKVALYFDNSDTAFDGGLVATGTFDGGSLYFGTVDITSNFAKCRVFNDHISDVPITIKYYLST